MDLVGPLPPSHGFTYLFTMVDRTTRWPEAVPLSSTTAPDLARAFIAVWVSRYGTPADLSSDRGPQFTSGLWAAVAENLGVKLHRTTCYHPQANGLVKRFHRSMKAALRASLRPPFPPALQYPIFIFHVASVFLCRLQHLYFKFSLYLLFTFYLLLRWALY